MRDDQPRDPLVELAVGALRLVLAPAAGGAIAALHDLHEGRRFDWLRPASADDLARREPFGMASFPLLPWCNRIRDSRAEAGGRRIALPAMHPARPSGRHALHGLGLLQPWRVEAASATGATLALDFEADDRWPWRFEASQRFEVAPDGLHCTITLTNRDSAFMPAGIGHHPYFPHRPGTRLTTGTAAMWRADAEVMPLALEAGDEVAKLRAGVRLDELDLDNNFTGWERRARIDWPDAGRALMLEAESPLDFFVLYCPRGGGHFCAEPVSQCTDQINLAPRFGPAQVGGALLAPGEALVGRWSLRSIASAC